MHQAGPNKPIGVTVFFLQRNSHATNYNYELIVLTERQLQ